MSGPSSRQFCGRTRREFLWEAGGGFVGTALTYLLFQDGFFGEARRAYLLGLLCYFRGYDAAPLGPARDLTVRQALDHWFRDCRLKLLLTADCP